MKDARRDEMEDELLALHVDRMSRVVPALVARDGGEMRGEHVDDLALAFVAPLRPEYCDVRLRHSGIS